MLLLLEIGLMHALQGNYGQKVVQAASRSKARSIGHLDDLYV